MFLAAADRIERRASAERLTHAFMAANYDSDAIKDVLRALQDDD